MAALYVIVPAFGVAVREAAGLDGILNLDALSVSQGLEGSPIMASLLRQVYPGIRSPKFARVYTCDPSGSPSGRSSPM